MCFLFRESHSRASRLSKWYAHAVFSCAFVVELREAFLFVEALSRRSAPRQSPHGKTPAVFKSHPESVEAQRNGIWSLLFLACPPYGIVWSAGPFESPDSTCEPEDPKDMERLGSLDSDSSFGLVVE
jgi:hypothetical protein